MTAGPGQHNIKDAELISVIVKFCQSLVPIEAGIHLVTGFSQKGFDCVAYMLVVLHKQNFYCHTNTSSIQYIRVICSLSVIWHVPRSAGTITSAHMFVDFICCEGRQSGEANCEN
jgi:hypothetical protein